MIGLILVAIGVYLTFVLYMGWDGGKVGAGADDALAFLLGKVAYAIPVTLFVTGAALILKPFLPAVKPLRTGGICVLAGLLLAFAAQTAALARTHPRVEQFDSAWFRTMEGWWGSRSTGRRARCSSESGPTSSPSCWYLQAPCC